MESVHLSTIAERMNHVFSNIILPLNIALIMFGMGLSVNKDDFIRVFRQPRTVVTGLAAHLIILPLVAFLLVVFLPIHPAVKVGLMLIAACPDGTTANLVNYWVKGNVALCLTLTVLLSFIILITLPLIVKGSLSLFFGKTIGFIPLPLGETILNVALVVLIPVISGLWVKSRYPRFAAKVEKPLETVLSVLLFFVYIAVIVIEQKTGTTTWRGYLSIFWLALALNQVAMLASYILAKKFVKDNRDSVTIAMQVGLQNSALAIYVATSLLKNPGIAVVAVVYGSFSFFTTLLFGYFAKKRGNTPTAV